MTSAPLASPLWPCSSRCASRPAIHAWPKAQSPSTPQLPMKSILLIVSGVLLLALMTGMSPPTKPTSPPTPLDPAAVLHDAADLVLLAVSQTCRVEQRVQGFVGNTTVAGDIRTTVWIGTDLTQARVISMDRTARNIELELPLPGAMQVSIDPLASRLTAERNGLWVLALDSTHEAMLVQTLFDEAQHMISQEVLEPHLSRRAQLHANTVLQQMFDASGWNVQLRWRGP